MVSVQRLRLLFMWRRREKAEDSVCCAPFENRIERKGTRITAGTYMQYNTFLRVSTFSLLSCISLIVTALEAATHRSLDWNPRTRGVVIFGDVRAGVAAAAATGWVVMGFALFYNVNSKRGRTPSYIGVTLAFFLQTSITVLPQCSSSSP